MSFVFWSEGARRVGGERNLPFPGEFVDVEVDVGSPLSSVCKGGMDNKGGGCPGMIVLDCVWLWRRAAAWT